MKRFLVISCLVLPGAVQADSIADSLSRIEAETLILKAQEKQIQVKAQIADREAEIASKQLASGRASRSATLTDPTVKGVEGIGRNLVASLLLENGSSIDVKAGETLANGMRIVSIRSNEVIAETQGRRRVRLAPAAPQAPAGATAYPAYPTAMVALPPLAPMTPAKGAAR
ncbi:type IV pilus biogenesis protein PilP [Collimonas sp. PA-H2]|uniref:type IV pilus biogenesis protein PilP n=1 Tax=Collimonas sp. PA-H2 TaxID=1881062 RepID=UPI001303FF18|nr:type IV pilus biogenesis protein PilP [Collimonas sp. PA-H2]